jgi:hypothetical protein
MQRMREIIATDEQSDLHRSFSTRRHLDTEVYDCHGNSMFDQEQMEITESEWNFRKELLPQINDQIHTDECSEVKIPLWRPPHQCSSSSSVAKQS